LHEQFANPCLTSSWERSGGGQHSEVGSERSNSLPRAQVEASDALALQFFACGTLILVYLADKSQQRLRIAAIHAINWHLGNMLHQLVNRFVHEAFFAAADFQKLAMQCREKSCLNIFRVSKLMPFTRPNAKGFLG